MVEACPLSLHRTDRLLRRAVIGREYLTAISHNVYVRTYVPEPPTPAAGTLGVASPPSVAAEAPPQVVSNGADVGDAPQDADATVQT